MNKPDENEDTGNLPGHQFTLPCGCKPHKNADLEDIDGCPVLFANILLNQCAGFHVMMAEVIDLLEQAIDKFAGTLPEEEDADE